jgi:hypothetical protein
MTARWAARLACGHTATTRGHPTPGTWMSCQQAGCRRPERILLAAPLPAVWVQDELFTAAEAA